MNAAGRARAISERTAPDAYGRAVQKAAQSLVEAIWAVPDPEDRVEAWKVAQRVLKPAQHYDFEVRGS